ncbi:MAG: nickel transporter [Paraburkholderia sp.]|uniref:HisA/HisF-related TIM barrel protein n=1 Tax=Paraburkholderia sp. TaxID=1926495 RepID=UPI0011F5B0EB|nr:HisA/HisF-related TIM barrel protein [Paraburkholderia sp.]TAL94854.1 MAG: nickel transporter [Paraburkholderia sp.]
MKIIPVLDLLDGAAVHAVRGERSRYRPVSSQLCEGSDPVDVARALLDHANSSVIYVADLDGIMHGAPQQHALMRLMRAMPGIELWLDAGFTDRDAASALIAPLHATGANVTPVFGSESLRGPKEGSSMQPALDADVDAPASAVENAIPHDAILSLDRRHDTPLGDPAHWHDASGWPSRVIVMSLERVGSFEGPDLAAIADVRRRAGQRQIIGAGGIRDADDLRAAETAGAHAWLIASALHDRRIPAARR